MHLSAQQTTHAKREMKFSSVEDASDFINAQLVLKGFLKQDTRLQFSSDAIDDKRLIINTLNRLLKSLDDKNVQINELHAMRPQEKPVEQPQFSKQESPLPLGAPSRPGKVVKHPATGTHLGSELLAKRYKVKLRRLESTTDALRQQLQLERQRKYSHVDLTWQISQDLTTPRLSLGSERRNDVATYRDKISSLLEARAHSRELEEQLVRFLETVNRYTYSMAIMGIRDLDLPTTAAQFHGLPNSELGELVADWYEIVALSRQSSTP